MWLVFPDSEWKASFAHDGAHERNQDTPKLTKKNHFSITVSQSGGSRAVCVLIGSQPSLVGSLEETAVLVSGNGFSCRSEATNRI